LRVVSPGVVRRLLLLFCVVRRPEGFRRGTILSMFELREQRGGESKQIFVYYIVSCFSLKTR
jgi:hypothetical protein